MRFIVNRLYLIRWFTFVCRKLHKVFFVILKNSLCIFRHVFFCLNIVHLGNLSLWILLKVCPFHVLSNNQLCGKSPQHPCFLDLSAMVPGTSYPSSHHFVGVNEGIEEVRFLEEEGTFVVEAGVEGMRFLLSRCPVQSTDQAQELRGSFLRAMIHG